MNDLGTDEHGESHHANRHTKHVDNVVSVLNHVAGTAFGNAPRLVLLDGAAEGLAESGCLGSGNASGGGEVVNQTKDEEAREGTAEVADAGSNGVSGFFSNKRDKGRKLT